MARIIALTLCLISPLFASIEKLEIKSLERSDPELKKIRAEVTDNLRLIADGEAPKIIWRTYRVKKKDTFFKVMARTVLNHDTLSSLNRLASIWDVTPGEAWLVPNVRGIAVFGDPKVIMKKFHKSAEQMFAVPGHERFYFIVGLHFDEVEKQYFSLKQFIHPVMGRITSGFGVRKDPFTEKHKFHKGIDIACAIGTSVVASAEGKVVFVGKKSGYGNTIIVEHQNGYQTLYGHLDLYRVKEGTHVKQGQIIARSGMSGRATGPHLHFEVRRQGKPERPIFHAKA